MTPSNGRDVLERYAAGLPRPVDVVAADLEIFAQLLRRWGRAKNLVSRETVDELWSRHMADSLMALPLLIADTNHCLDLGSGGGFPAIPLAIALKGLPIRFTLIESNGRKGAFLRAAVRDLGLAVTAITARFEAVDPAAIGSVDAVTVRAVAPLERLFAAAEPFWSADTRGLFHKGRDHGEEIIKAGAAWRFEVVKHPGLEAGGVILEVFNLEKRTHSAKQNERQ